MTLKIILVCFYLELETLILPSKSISKFSDTKIQNVVKNTVPVLGICLGMEMFFEKSEEGKEKGLGIMDGEVVVSSVLNESSTYGME